MFGGMSPAAAREHLVAAVDRNGQYVDWDRDTGKLNVYVSERGADDGEVTLDGHFTKQDLVALITLWPAT
jgi:hypothetical protein